MDNATLQLTVTLAALEALLYRAFVIIGASLSEPHTKVAGDKIGVCHDGGHFPYIEIIRTT